MLVMIGRYKDMLMKNVVSSSIRAIGYENGTLEVEFHTKGTFRYYNVPLYIYNELMTSSSLGGYFSQRIKSAYKGHKI